MRDREANYDQVPAAFFCAHGPHFYAIVSASRAYDNSAPQTFKDNILNENSLDDKVKTTPATSRLR
jgi:hypothetical protein